MKKIMNYKLCLAMLMTAVAGSVGAGDIRTSVLFRGSLFNSPTRQAIHGRYNGRGEYGILDEDANFTGNVSSKPGTRIPQPQLTGIYPVTISGRVEYSDASESDSDDTNVTIRRRSIIIDNHGTIRLDRAIDPNRMGRQRVRGTGVLRYDF